LDSKPVSNVPLIFTPLNIGLIPIATLLFIQYPILGEILNDDVEGFVSELVSELDSACLKSTLPSMKTCAFAVAVATIIVINRMTIFFINYNFCIKT
jgi:hypothetical protein